jgi:hypothetical protein
VLAGSGTARVVDCSDLDWIDVDDAKALDYAEKWIGVAVPFAIQAAPSR